MEIEIWLCSHSRLPATFDECFSHSAGCGYQTVEAESVVYLLDDLRISVRPSAVSVEQADKKDLKHPSQCDHEWVDARNDVIESGEICLSCMSVRAGNEATEGEVSKDG